MHTYMVLFAFFFLRSNPLAAPAPSGHLQNASGHCGSVGVPAGPPEKDGKKPKPKAQPKPKALPKAKTAVQEATQVFRLVYLGDIEDSSSLSESNLIGFGIPIQNSGHEVVKRCYPWMQIMALQTCGGRIVRISAHVTYKLDSRWQEKVLIVGWIWSS